MHHARACKCRHLVVCCQNSPGDSFMRPICMRKRASCCRALQMLFPCSPPQHFDPCGEHVGCSNIGQPRACQKGMCCLSLLYVSSVLLFAVHGATQRAVHCARWCSTQYPAGLGPTAPPSCTLFAVPWPDAQCPGAHAALLAQRSPQLPCCMTSHGCKLPHPVIAACAKLFNGTLTASFGRFNSRPSA